VQFRMCRPRRILTLTTTVLLAVLMVLGATAVPSVTAEGPLYSCPTRRFGFGIQPRWGDVTDYDIRSLNAGWYSDWGTVAQPARPGGIEYAQLVWVSNGTFSPSMTVLETVIEANPGSLWMIGNEPECIWQGNSTPEQYADVYHQLYPFIKQRDPSAQIALGGVVEPTPLRLQWLERVLTYYQAKYGAQMPVDVWNIHIQILPEEKNSWGCEIPRGLDATEGRLYEIQENDSIQIFQQLVQEMRSWMHDRGFADKPLIISEYGVLMPVEYGFDEVRVNAFMDATFDYLLAAQDAATGYAEDEDRLVQRWLWYSLNEEPYDVEMRSKSTWMVQRASARLWVMRRTARRAPILRRHSARSFCSLGGSTSGTPQGRLPAHTRCT